jgi:gas vesicle protein GvpL/GvpF
MVTYLYCVLAPPRTEALPPGLTGIAGAPVRAIVVPDRAAIEAWVATIDEKILHVTGSPLAKLALVHNEVVEAALATGRTPLPARFGTRFADDDALLHDVQGRHRGLLDRLQHVAEAIEMSVLVVPTGHGRKALAGRTRDEPGPGRRYLESIRERTRSEELRYRGANSVADRVSEAVSRFARGEVRSTSSSVLSLAHLVWLGDVTAYRRTLSELDVGSEFRIIVGGPRAPYTFAAER